MDFHQFDVFPKIPEKLEPLREIAMNLWFSWNWDAVRLFVRLGQDTWDASGLCPTKMLAMMSQERLEEAAEDESLLYSLERVALKLHNYMEGDSWFRGEYPDCGDLTIAYFSAEYGIDASLPIYSGGLGMLAGDHLKSASDLGIPLVTVGLLYDQGYFHQYLNADGWQQESYPHNEFAIMPVAPVKGTDGSNVRVSVKIAGDEVIVEAWKAQVGRVPLYLLTTNVEENKPEHRGITKRLYGGDRTTRIRQEIVLGIGGVRVLDALGIRPAVFHMNEGHSAFLALERILQLMGSEGMSFAEAREAVWGTNVFTTHTPVPAGIDVFDSDLLWKHFGEYSKRLGLSWQEFLALGRRINASGNEPFSMAVLAINLAAFCNGVSKLHGEVSRRMWTNVFPRVDDNDVPITSITNGIHTRGWLSHDMAELMERYLGQAFVEEPMNTEVWKRVHKIPDGELWNTHERRRERMISVVRRRLREQLIRRSAPRHEIEAAEEALDPDALTIGFARRFATYKRSTLLLRQTDRLAVLLNDPERPVQLVFAGKAHPQDVPGKELIRAIVKLARDERFRGRVVFIENYDMILARYLVRGCDVWLNTPRRPREASGTSGMKAAANGCLNLSILDGWWAEGYSHELGWAIGSGEEYHEDHETQDQVESEALFDLLEREVIPLFYDRGRDNLPRDWIAMMKACMATLGPMFSTHRMTSEYAGRLYVPAIKENRRLAENGFAAARELAKWRARMRKEWKDVSVVNVERTSRGDLAVGAELEVRAVVSLGRTLPENVSVNLCFGPLDPSGRLRDRKEVLMELSDERSDGKHVYVGKALCKASGRHGFAVRVLPHNDLLVHPYDPGLIAWG